MFANLMLMTLAASPAAEPAKEPPAKLELFAKEDWYKGQKGKEEALVGVLKFKEMPKDVVGFNRYNPYTLVMDNAGKNVREVYVGGKPDLLKPYIGKTIKLIGKKVDMEVEGKAHLEIWPARLEVVAVKKEEKSPEQARQEATLKELDRLIKEAEALDRVVREKSANAEAQTRKIKELEKEIADLERVQREKELEAARRKQQKELNQEIEKKPDPTKEVPAKADILANHKLYKMEPGAEKVFEGTIQKDKEAKGGYYLSTQADKAYGRLNLQLYPDAGDPLAPYLDKKVRITGKHVTGAVGMRTFAFILPGRLELIEEKK